MPSYNHARFLAEAVESVWAQTTGAIELIVVDDGSTDGSARLLEELRERSPIPMTVIVQPNGGVARALNRALESARGEWVCFLASDDRFAPDFVQEQLSAANGKPGDFVQHANAMIIDEFGNRRGTIDQLSTRTPYQGDAFELLLGATGRIVSSTLFLRTSLLCEVGGFDPDMAAEDFDLHLRLSRRARFDYIDKPIFFARELSTSLGRKPWIWADGIIAAIAKHRDRIGDRYPEILRKRMLFLSETCFASAGWRSGLGWGLAAIREAPTPASKLASIGRLAIGFALSAPRAIAHKLLPDVVIRRLRATRRRGQERTP